ncbi:MAG: peptidylprolyl isomerase, partial [Burkholderiales bacterium]|nr:peptidylprolyl isomerase [Burkholderiales bacterium]
MKKLLFVIALLFSTAASAANPQVELTTNLGRITLELYPDRAPQTVENFLQYVKDGFYSGTVFHRVIGNFMIQGGGHTRDIYNGS